MPFTARALLGDELLCESSAALEVDPLGPHPRLYFPTADVKSDAARDVVLEKDPGDADLALADYVAFHPERVVVELVDPMDGVDPRDVTTKRFPLWGDAADLIDILDVRKENGGRYVSVVRGRHVRPVVEGSQMLGQAIVAAGRHCPHRRVVSAHMVFSRRADAMAPLRLELEELTNGRSFSTLSVVVKQFDAPCATGTLLLDVTSDDLVRHQAAAPDVPGPYESDPCDMSVTGRDIRVVDGAYTGNPDAPTGPPTLDAWVRFREVPADQPMHSGLLAQFTGHMPIAAALRPHAGIGQDQAHRTLSTAINAISLSIHDEVRADEWMLYDHRSTFAGGGMTHAECRVHDQKGTLLASFTVDAMVRRFGMDRPQLDESRAL